MSKVRLSAWYTDRKHWYEPEGQKNTRWAGYVNSDGFITRDIDNAEQFEYSDIANITKAISASMIRMTPLHYRYGVSEAMDD